MAFGEKSNSRVNKDKGPALGDKLKSNGKTGKRLTILSIDGGGIRGIIPAKILQVLEGHLRELEGNGEHNLWEYFDLIAGTSSGGLITAMITTPSVQDPQVPIFNAREVVEFFRAKGVKIFPETFTNKCCPRWLLEGIASVFGSIRSAKPLEKLLRKKFGEALLSGALTSVIIPAFDTYDEVPVFFSNLKGVDKANPLYNVRVKDACLATTAAPILFPAARFEGQVSGDNNQPAGTKVFNVIDGGIAVNDPTLVAVIQAITQERHAIAKDKESIEEQLQNIKRRQSSAKEQRERQEIKVEPLAIEEDLKAIEEDIKAIEEDLKAIVKKRSRDCTDFSNVLVLSLGTGQYRMRFIANPHWSSVQWLLNRSGSPLLSSFLSASADMVEYYTSMIFDADKAGGHYLRIQTDKLSESEVLEIDDADRQNLNQLEETADELVGAHEDSRRNFAPRTPGTTTITKEHFAVLLRSWLKNGSNCKTTLVREKAAAV